jgi:hypothetical protein
MRWVVGGQAVQAKTTALHWLAPESEKFRRVNFFKV